MFNGFYQPVELRIGIVAAPVHEHCCLNALELERNGNVLDQHRQQTISIGGRRRFGLDPSRLHGLIRPQDDDATRRIQLFLDYLIEGFT
jgi:hypothetical protein